MNTLIVNVRDAGGRYHARAAGKVATATCGPDCAVRACADKVLPKGAEVVKVSASPLDATRRTWCVDWQEAKP